MRASKLCGLLLTIVALSTLPGCSDGPAAVQIKMYEASGATLSVTYSDSACTYESRSIAVTESEAEVRVSITAPRTDSEACLDGVLVTSQVPLDQPLGERAVIDGSTGDPVPDGTLGSTRD